MKITSLFLVMLSLGILLAAPAPGLEASFDGGPITSVVSNNTDRFRMDGGFKFAAVLDFPLKSDVWDVAPQISYTNVIGATGSGINSISSIGWNLGFEVHPWRDLIVRPLLGGYVGPVFISRNTTSGSTNEFGANAGVYLGGSFKTGSLTFLLKGMYEYVQGLSSGSLTNFSTVSALAGVEILIDVLFGL